MCAATVETFALRKIVVRAIEDRGGMQQGGRKNPTDDGVTATSPLERLARDTAAYMGVSPESALRKLGAIRAEATATCGAHIADAICLALEDPRLLHTLPILLTADDAIEAVDAYAEIHDDADLANPKARRKLATSLSHLCRGWANELRAQLNAEPEAMAA